MPLETATYIADLVSTNPPGTDQVSQADDHLRLIKAVLQNTFPLLSRPLDEGLQLTGLTNPNFVNAATQYGLWVDSDAAGGPTLTVRDETNTDLLTLNDLALAALVDITSTGDISATGDLVAGANITASGSVTATSLSGNLVGALQTAAQPNVTSLGTLTALTVSGAITASGGQIVFPATQNASSNANTLDDYEEGTFSVTFTSGTGTVTVDTTNDTLSYVKIGQNVFVQGRVDLLTISVPTGLLTMNGLPFTAATLTEISDLVYFTVQAAALDGSPFTNGLLTGLVQNGTTTVQLYHNDFTNVAGNLTTSSQFGFNFHYRASA